MSNQVKQVVETQEERAIREENEKLAAQMKANRQRLKSMKGVTCELCEVKSSGAIGFRIVGLGTPKFFYKQHARTLFGDTPEAAEQRAKILAWLEENEEELTDKR